MRSTEVAVAAATQYTWTEISGQMALWPTTLERVQTTLEKHPWLAASPQARVLLTGAGTSAYASSAIAAAWPGATAVPSTDLLVDLDRHLAGVDIVISVARSGNSPESLATVEAIRDRFPTVRQAAITCNASGKLAQSADITPVILDPRTDDQSLAMTSSFSNLVLAGLALADTSAVASVLGEACSRATQHFAELHHAAERIAALVRERVVLLSSSPLSAWAQEGSLKVSEMTAGRFAVLPETYLGLRHGPMVFVQPDTLVLCLLSNHPTRRRYELDLVAELRSKGLGHLIGIGATADETGYFETILPAVLPDASDDLRTPFEIVAPQLLGYCLSLRLGLNPDNPSLSGVINRVVQGVRIY